MLDRLYAFYDLFDEVGNQLNKARDSYDKAVRRLKEGDRNQSVVQAGNKLIKLGVKMKKTRNIPTRLSLPEEEEETVELPLLEESEQA